MHKDPQTRINFQNLHEVAEDCGRLWKFAIEIGGRMCAVPVRDKSHTSPITGKLIRLRSTQHNGQNVDLSLCPKWDTIKNKSRFSLCPKTPLSVPELMPT